MIDIDILKGLSFSGAQAFLLESGYEENAEIRRLSPECDVLVIVPYIQYGEDGCVIDRVGHFEFCMLDGEETDWKCCWKRF